MSVGKFDLNSLHGLKKVFSNYFLFNLYISAVKEGEVKPSHQLTDGSAILEPQKVLIDDSKQPIFFGFKILKYS